jgi:hypothetical protein
MDSKAVTPIFIFRYDPGSGCRQPEARAQDESYARRALRLAVVNLTHTDLSPKVDGGTGQLELRSE